MNKWNGSPGDNIGFTIKAKNLGANDIIKGAVVSNKDNPASVMVPNKDGFLALVLVVCFLEVKVKLYP